jgi:hypothetical protein
MKSKPVKNKIRIKDKIEYQYNTALPSTRLNVFRSTSTNKRSDRR